MKRLTTLFSILTVIIFTVTLFNCIKENSPDSDEDLTETISDTEAPSITDFFLNSGNPTMNPNILFTLTGIDNVGITGWMINESSIPPDAGGGGWIEAKPTGYSLSNPGAYGTRTIYAWAKDNAGNVSDSLSFEIEYKQDSELPTITGFSLTSPDPTSSANITFALTASDNSGTIAGWMINESSAKPDSGDSRWLSTKPTGYPFADSGTYETKTIYAWAKDPQGNVSDYDTFSLVYQQPPVPENLVEMCDRKGRRVTAIWGAEYLEDPNTYVWQPESFMYHDVTTGHEVWKMSNTPLLVNYYHNDISVSPWSADGSKMAFSAFDRSILDYNYGGESRDRVWITMDTDGSNPRPTVEGAQRDGGGYFQWSAQVPGEYFEIGNRVYGAVGVSNKLYRSSVDASGVVTTNPILTLPSEAASGYINKMVSADGRKIIIEKNGNYFPISILPDGTAQFDVTGIDVPNGYSMDRDFGPYGDTKDTTYTSYHNQFLPGLGDWIFARPGGEYTWWRYATNGSAADGGALYTGDDGNHNFGEVWPENHGDNVPPENMYSPFVGTTVYQPDKTSYWSHFAPDRWGRHALFTNTADNLPINRGGYFENIGPGVWDFIDHHEVVSSHGHGAQHHDWDGFTDWTVSSTNDEVKAQKYDVSDSQFIVNNAYARYDGGTKYFTLIRPGQSPDGTKVSWTSEFLNAADKTDIFWSVVYNPYPPTDLKAVSASSVELRFLPPKYTDRRWINPATGLIDETNGEVLYAREIKEYQVWRSASSSSGWDIAGTVSAVYGNDPVTNTLKPRANGDWVSAANKITFSDNPEDGVWYYAITSTEHSGLESDELSEVLQVTVSGGAVISSGIVQAQGQTGFWTISPTVPSNFTYNSTGVAGHYQLSWTEPVDGKIRYYNIYYSTSGNPGTNQSERIASLPAGIVATYLDWIADRSVSGYYGITSVDRYGNESSIVYP